MCSSVDKAVENSDISLQKADQTLMATQQQNANLAFSEQQSVLSSLNAKMSYLAANPLGYTPQELHMMTTNVNESTSKAATQAIGAASAFAAAHGAADVGGGATGQIAGEIGSAAAQSKAQQLTGIAQASAQLKQQNYWKAIQGLNQVGSELGGANSTAVGGAEGASNAGTTAGGGAVSADTAATSKVAGMLNAVGGLVTAGTGFNLGGGAAPAMGPIGGDPSAVLQPGLTNAMLPGEIPQ